MFVIRLLEGKLMKAFMIRYQRIKMALQAIISPTYKKKKAISKLRGFTSIFDYLLYDQKVPKAFMDRQIDLIMTKLAPAFRKYALHIKELHKLDQMTYADLKIALDPEFEVKVSIDEAKSLVKKGLSIFW